MAGITETKSMTLEDLLSFPDDGVDRWLIRGELRENKEANVNRRNPWHCTAMSNLVHLIRCWVLTQPIPRGNVLSGDAAFRICRNPETIVGIDIAYISAALLASLPRKISIVDGVPILAIEILSPSDTHSDVAEKIEDYLTAGVALVWIVDPDFQTVTVHQTGADPQFFNRNQILSADPHLPGLWINVAEIFC